MFVGRRWACWLLGVALVASSCGGGDATTPDVETIDSGSDATGNAVDDPTVKRASELAVMLVDQLGHDDSAVGALLLAGDTGYSINQIEAAIVSATLAADGSIVGVQPVRDTAGLISALSANQPNGVRIALKANTSAQDADDRLPIEKSRAEAAEMAGFDDYWPTGASATSLILSWQLQGYSQEQIVDMLILGIEFVDGDYEGPIADGYEECGGYLIGGTHESPQFCDPDTGELYPDDEATNDRHPSEAVEPAPSGLCDGSFTPPYELSVYGIGAMNETQILGPLETKYYYQDVTGTLAIEADGTFTLAAETVRYGDIIIRDEPDHQIYTRNFKTSGIIDLTTGQGEFIGTVTGTDQLWSGDSKNPIGILEAAGEATIVCHDDQADFTIVGIATSGAPLEFQAYQ